MSLPATERTSDPALNDVLALRMYCSDRDIIEALAVLLIRRNVVTARDLADEVARARAFQPKTGNHS